MLRSIPTAFAIVAWWCTAAFAQPIQLEVSPGQAEARPPEASSDARVPGAIGAPLPAPTTVDRVGRTELLNGQERSAYAVSSKFADTAAPMPITGTAAGQGGYFAPTTDPWAGFVAGTNQWSPSAMTSSLSGAASVRAWTLTGASTGSIRSSAASARSSAAGAATRSTLQALRPSPGAMRR